jgi:hypothetical protein
VVPGRAEEPNWVEALFRVLATGLLGLWWSRPSAMRRRLVRRRECTGCLHRYRRLMRLLIILAWLQICGVVVLLGYGVQVRTCQPPAWSTAADAARYLTPGDSWIIPTRQVLTSGNSGLALAYSKLRGAEICRYAPTGNLIASMHGGFARGGTMYGQTFVTLPRPDYTYPELEPVVRHEARHTDQWALFTVLGGPLAFPLSYSIDEIFAPGPYNQFERNAGLAGGGYVLPDGPSPTTTRLLVAAAVAAVVIFERHRVRRQIHLLVLLARRVRAAEEPWWYAHTKPVIAGRLSQLVARVSPTAAEIITDHRRMHQLGCRHCGDL